MKAKKKIKRQKNLQKNQKVLMMKKKKTKRMKM